MIDIAVETLRWYEWGRIDMGSEASAAPVQRGPGRPLAAGVDALERAVALLEAGGVMAHPTSTVYGLGGRPARRIDERISALKRRPPGPLIRLAASREALRDALPGVRWSGPARRLADAFWPGPLTLVLEAGSEDGGEAGIAARVDPHPVVRWLLERAGGLMTSTSLNETGRPPARTRREVREALVSMGPQDGSVGWLDAGDLEAAPPSTLVRVRGETVEVLREGALSALEIERILRRPGRPGAPE